MHFAAFLNFNFSVCLRNINMQSFLLFIITSLQKLVIQPVSWSVLINSKYLLAFVGILISLLSIPRFVLFLENE